MTRNKFRRHVYQYRSAILSLLICMLMSGLTIVQSQIHENAGTRAMTFLKIGIGAEGISMGEAQVAHSNDLYATFWNPAGLANIKQQQFGFMHNEWLGDINHEYIGFAQPVSGLGTMAGCLVYLNYCELIGRDASGNETKPFHPYDIALILSMARQFGNLSVGTNLKWVREKILNGSEAEQLEETLGGGDIRPVDASTPALDICGLYTFQNQSGEPGPFSVGVNLQHLGRVQFIEESFLLPVNLKMGMAYRMLEDSAVITADLNRPSDNKTSIGIGLAFTVLKFFHLRSGYKYALGGNDLGALSGITFGLGASMGNFQIDYALISMGQFGPTHRLSLLAKF